MSDFTAPWWCRNRHLQTIWGPLFRRKQLAFTRERFVLADGDFVDLDWLDPLAHADTARSDARPRHAEAALIGHPVPASTRDPSRTIAGASVVAFAVPGLDSQASVDAFAVSRLDSRASGAGDASAIAARANGGVERPAIAATAVSGASDAPMGPRTPLLLVLHGLEGSSASHYVVGLLEGARARGWRGVALNFRSCSGEMNRLPRFYHSGDTADLDAVVRLIVARDPGVRIGIVGVSLGGNVALKWLGELGQGVPAAVAGAVGISVPFDLTACARVLDRGFGKHVYTRNFLHTMRRKAIDKERAHPGCVDVEAARRARTFAAYDRVVTAPLFGFADELDYWRRASCRPFLASIARPTLAINATDDPFVPADAVPAPAELSASVRLLLTERGGHVGFLRGSPWRADSWAENHALDFLAPLLRD